VIQLVVFGTGNSAMSFRANLDMEKVEIVSYLDNNVEKHGKEYDGVCILPPSQINSLPYDYIIIASQFTLPIYEQLIKMGVSPVQILPLYPIRHTQQLLKGYRVALSKLYRKSNHKDEHSVTKIDLVSMYHSGCNVRALYSHMPDWVSDRYEVRMKIGIYEDQRQPDCVVTTHRNITLGGDGINVELWHGFPLKAMGKMHSQSDEDSAGNDNWLDAHRIASYSQLYSTLMSACFPTTTEQYAITGLPRNDYLFHSNGRALLGKIFGIPFECKKILLYMPTFRVYKSRETEEGNRLWDNLFDFDQFDEMRFSSFLKDQDLIVIVKLHEFEEQVWKEKVLTNSNILLLSQQLLNHHDLDVYEILNAADILITDYSSVYFDYLLLDRPLLFTPTDLERYRSNRGLLLEPYEWWTPGDKALTQDELQQGIIRALDTPTLYMERRKVVCDMVHHYQDGSSSERVWRMIDHLLGVRK
jgi:CDP-ribitol ribitolphosphotransferase